MKIFNFFILAIGLVFFTSCAQKDHRLASRKSADIAPKPEELEESIFQIYYARAFEWRGNWAVHTWISWKKKEDEQYTVTQAIGWRLDDGLSVLKTEKDIPDRLWFDAKPTILLEARGKEAEKMIARTKELVDDYPYTDEYGVYPGPNSNTYISYLIRQNEHIKIELPPTAIGKDWPVENYFLMSSPSGTGFQLSLFGVLGLTLGLGEGIEANVIGLNFGVDFYPFALKLPMYGRLGWPDAPL